MLESTFYPRLC